MTLSFTRVLNSFFSVVEEGSAEIINDKIKGIDLKINEVHRKFFKRLVAKTIGKSVVPDLGSYTPVWDPLGKKYVADKQKRGYSKGFFERTGELKTTLAGLNPKTVWGSPIITLTPLSVVGKTGVSLREERWYKGTGKEKLVRKVRDAKGRFASARDIPRTISSSLTVNPYPKIPFDIRDKDIDEHDYFNQDIVNKLININGKKRRLITPFLNWYLDNELAGAVK